MNRISIQAQDTSGNWRTYSITATADSQRVLSEMKALSSRYPSYRIRAVDENGRVVDIL